MNTHDKYELPPLPDISAVPEGMLRGLMLMELDRHARAAIEPYAKRIAELEAARIAYASEFPPNQDGEPDVGSIHENIRKLKADRKRRGEPVGESQRVYLHDEGFPEYLDGARCQYVIERGKPYPHGDTVAFVYEKEDAERIVAALNEPCRGEPVMRARIVHEDGEVIDPDIGWTSASFDRLPHGTELELYATPQPAEPCASSVSDKTACGSANGDCDSQPSEPVKVPSDDLAHEIWAAAQTAPGEGIEDAVERVAALLARYGKGTP